jgi:hypothetical protein
MLRRKCHLLLFLLTALLWTGVLQANDRRLDAAGSTHWVTVESYVAPGGTQKIDALVYHMTDANGTTFEEPIVATQDMYIDDDASLEIDPVRNVPVIIWTRDEGDGADLFISRRDAGLWSTPRRIFTSAPDESRPSFRITYQYIHLHWDRPADSQVAYDRIVLDRKTLTSIMNPEAIQSETAGIVPLIGNRTDGATDSLPSDLMYNGGFLADIDSGESDQAIVWGIRDEPVPIGYVRRFEIDPDVRSPQSFDIRWMADRLVFSYSSPELLYYSVHEINGWSETRSIPLANRFDEEAARDEIERSLSARDPVPAQ